MKILIFTEGTIIMHASAKGKTREEIVQQSKDFGVRMESKILNFNDKVNYSNDLNNLHDYLGHIPNGHAVVKIKTWRQQGATIYYLTSRRVKSEIEAIEAVLQKYHFPDSQNLLFRQKGEDYKDIAERLMPDVLIEDDCESIGGEKEMTYTYIREDLKPKIKSVIVKEFGGIDHLTGNIEELK